MFVTGLMSSKRDARRSPKQELGEAHDHNATSVSAHFIGARERRLLALIREFCSAFSSNNVDDPPPRHF